MIRLRSLGDAILTLPLVEALHHWRPDLKQTILIEAPFASVFADHPDVDEVLVLRNRKMPGQGGWSRNRALLELVQRRFPAALNLHGGSTSMLLMLASGSRLRLGQKSHRGSWLYNRLIPPSAGIWQRTNLHTVEHQLSLIRWLGLAMPARPASLHINADAQARTDERLKEVGISDFILLQPTATLTTKQWKPEYFAQLGDALTERYGIQVVYTAAGHEKAILETISLASSKNHLYWSDLPLAELFALIARCRLFVGCDSGPAHAAAALRKPVVVVWGSSNLEAWHPWQTRYEAIKSELPCMPCPGYSCSRFSEPRCILDIQPATVIEACTRILEMPGLA